MTEYSKANLVVAQHFIDALNAGDGDTVRNIYTPDARIWHNFSTELQSVADNIKTLAWMHRKLSNIAYDIQRLEAISGGYLQQHILRGTLATGEAFAMHACAICTVKDGRITALEEYLNIDDTKPLYA